MEIWQRSVTILAAIVAAFRGALPYGCNGFYRGPHGSAFLS
jgi:hypothetical protein